MGEVEITYPHIETFRMFDAYLLAQCRDYAWLFKQGGRRKGIDLSTPIITSDKKPKGKKFKAEEGNLGKLMRIAFDSDLPKTIPNFERLRKEAEEYENFKEAILLLGITETFREVCFLMQASDCGSQSLNKYPKPLTEIGSAKVKGDFRFGVFAGSPLASIQTTARFFANSLDNHSSVSFAGTIRSSRKGSGSSPSKNFGIGRDF